MARPMRRTLAGTMLVASAALPSPGSAETSKSFPVTAVVVNGCSVATDGNGNWGTIDLGTTPGTAGATVQATLASAGGAGIVVQCTPGVTATLAADAGANAVAGARYLKMVGGVAKIAYRLYANGASTVWTTDTLSLPFTTGSTSRTVPVRSVATLAAAMPAGTYTDTVRVTLTW